MNNVKPNSTQISFDRILIIIPAYNEESNIVNVLESLKATNSNWHLLVVNDGSSDQTSKFARMVKNVSVLDLPVNLGIGGGVQSGFLYALRNKYDYAVQFDGDGQHPAESIEKLIQPLREKKANVVIGSRFIGEGLEGFQSSASRLVGIRYFSWLNSVLCHQRITDNTSGFRAYDCEAIQFLCKYYPNDYPEPEAVVLLKKNNFKLLEIPVKMKERQGGVSSIRGFKPIFYMIKVSLSILIAASRAPVRKKK
jgi:glycosyltransferase involved in cell wall biosynthesis